VLGRFSGVGVDLLYDHFLAKNFARLHPEVLLRTFAEDAQSDLLNRTVEMPARSQRFLHAMVAHDWLVQYGSRKGMLSVCRSMDARLEQRLQTTSPLHRLFEAADAAGFDDLEASFAPFWMRIQTEARSFVQSESLLAC
jgi:acyl carrier protein phosphodiesterase